MFCEEVPRRLAIWYRYPFLWNQVPIHVSEEVPSETLVFQLFGTDFYCLEPLWNRQNGHFCEEVPRGLAIWNRRPI